MADGHLDITVSGTDTTVSLVLAGEIDPHTAPQLEADIKEAVDRTPQLAELVVDLSAVSFMDSSGLRVIITAHHLLADKGGKLVLASPSDTVGRLLEITQLKDEIEIR